MGTFTANPVEPEVAPHVTSSNAERIGRHYLFWLLLVPVLGYLFPFFAEKMPALKDWSVSQWGRKLDYGYNLSHENADIVLFGDSTALYGVDTPYLSRQLGMKVINIPGSMGSLQITSDHMLRHYLATNRPPRLIVFYFTPGHLDFKYAQNQYSYEGDEQILRNEPPSAWINLARERPLDVLLFPFRFYQAPSKLTKFYELKRLEKINMSQGYMPNIGKPPLATSCSLPPEFFAQTNTRSVQELMRDYTSTQTRTLAYLAPLPDCQHASEIAAMRYTGVNVEAPAVLSAQNFEQDQFYVHPLSSSADKVTDLLATRIQSMHVQ